MTLAERILCLFRGREDHVAVATDKGFEPKPLTGPLKARWLESEHLSQKRCLGFYVLTAASQCHCSCVDYDNKAEHPDPAWRTKTESMYYALTQLGLTPLVEVSQSGQAAHVWLFFAEAVPAWLARQFWAAVAKEAQVPLVEVYPRQDALSGKGFGNLVRYPLFGQSQFVDVESDWAAMDPEQALADVRATDAVTLSSLCFSLTGTMPKSPEAGVVQSGLSGRVDRLVSREHSLLGRRWRGDMEGLRDASRSALCQSIACELVRQYVPTPEVEQAIKVWCDREGYAKGERDEWIGSTVAKAYDFVTSRDAERTSSSWTLSDALHELVDRLGTEPPHIRSGLLELDNSIDGVGVGEMCVIAARPSHGKTAFALQWLESAALYGTTCLFISEEMSKLELAKRALLRISELDAADWDAHKAALHSEITRYHSQRRPIYGIESCQSIDAAERLIEQHCQLHDVRLVAVDYLQLLNSRGGSRYEEVTDISRRLKQAALRNRCAVLALCQLNRDSDRRRHDSRRDSDSAAVCGFRMSDLRESGQIEQDADLILYLEWPFRNNTEEDPEAYFVRCGKRRNGPIREPLVRTTFNPDRQTFGKYHADFTWTPNPNDYAERYT